MRWIAIGRLLGAAAVIVFAFAGFAAGAAQAAAPAWRVLSVASPTHLPPVTEEVQEVSVDAAGGTFTLAFEGQSTGALLFDAPAAAVQSALDSLPSVSGDSGEVKVTGGPGTPGGETPYFVKFGGGLGGRNVPELTADGSALQGGAGTVTVRTSVEGEDSFKGGSLAISVTNVGGGESSAEPALTAAIGPLPAGLESQAIEVGGWICPPAAEGATAICTHSLPIPPLEGAETLKIPLVVEGSVAAPGSTIPVTISGGGAPAMTDVIQIVVSSTPAQPGIADLWAGAFDANGNPLTLAGSHPYSAATAFWLNSDLSSDGSAILPAGALRTAGVGLPPGFVGNPLVTQSRCPQEALSQGESSPVASPLCTFEAAKVGGLSVALGGYGAVNLGGTGKAPVLNDIPAQGSAAEFSANVAAFGNLSLFGSVRSSSDFGVDITGLNLSTQLPVWANATFIEGFPASALGKPFLRNPTDCSVTAEEAAAGRGPQAILQMNSWANPDPDAIEDEVAAVQPAVTGCGALTQAWVGRGPEPEQERPTLSITPSASQAASVTAATAHLHIPQRGLTDPNRLGSSDLKKTVVTLPTGLTLNPSAANGLQSCSEAQVGYIGSGFPMPNPTRFDEAPVTCPEASRLGPAKVKTPLLEEELEGTIYLAAQEDNPFGSLLALYLVIESKRFGITLKLPGEVKPNLVTGQLTATFDDNPQVPFEDLTLQFRGGGPRSQLATPELCGTFKSTGELTPWSAETESPAEAAPIEEPGFQITSGPGGGACATTPGGLPFSPSFEAGTASVQAGAYAPLIIKLARHDGEQELTHLDFTLPPGLTAKLAGVPYCSAAAIDAARGKTGKGELASPSCPASSQIGTVDTAAGVGMEPVHVGGHVYLAGPYRGAPLSSVVITPAVAGPFDLGNVVVQAPLYVDPVTAQITARTDELPHILKGIPLKLRSVEIKVDRPGFSLNPTSCNAMTASAKMTGLEGATASPSSRFQVGNCKSLPFKPKLKISVLGPTNRNSKPRLKAVLTAKPGEANIRRAQVNLPHSEFIEQNHIKTVCTRAQFAQGDGNGSACPAGSIYGHAKAWTPLLDKPLEGPVYLRSSSNQLPDLVAALDGQIDVALDGKVDSGQNHGIRNTFEVVPDAPVSRFVLEMAGGKKGLLVNSENLCSKKAKTHAIVRLAGQNGKVEQFKPKVANDCGKARKGGGKKKR